MSLTIRLTIVALVRAFRGPRVVRSL